MVYTSDEAAALSLLDYPPLSTPTIVNSSDFAQVTLSWLDTLGSAAPNSTNVVARAFHLFGTREWGPW